MGTTPVSAWYFALGYPSYQQVAMLPALSVSIPHCRYTIVKTYHARAGEGVPAEADAILVLNVAPLVLQGLVVGHGVWYGVCLGSACGLWWDQAAPTIRIRGAGAEGRRRSWGARRGTRDEYIGCRLGIARLQQMCKVATCPKAKPRIKWIR